MPINEVRDRVGLTFQPHILARLAMAYIYRDGVYSHGVDSHGLFTYGACRMANVVTENKDMNCIARACMSMAYIAIAYIATAYVVYGRCMTASTSPSTVRRMTKWSRCRSRT